jgi:hypothetical protein
VLPLQKNCPTERGLVLPGSPPMIKIWFEENVDWRSRSSRRKLLLLWENEINYCSLLLREREKAQHIVSDVSYSLQLFFAAINITGRE